MNNSYSLLIPILLPVVSGLLLYALKGKNINRSIRGGFVILISMITAGVVIYLSSVGEAGITLFWLTKDIPIRFYLDGMGMFFAILTSLMWVVSAIYQMEYLKHEKNEERYHLFFFLALAALLGICFSGNLVTMYLFYELMTLSTFGFVIHTLTKEAIKATFKYLFYSMGGAFLALAGIFYLSPYVTSYTFTTGGVLNQSLVEGKEAGLLVVVFLMIIGFGCKAGSFPLHGWLPVAHPVAPAPASALMSGNVTKMGVLAIIRLIYYIVGDDFIRGTWVQYAFLGITLLTILMGSMMAYKEQGLKRRLAYSSVSQVSYILFGVAVLDATALSGALLHVVFHSIVKNLLFLTAGAIIYKTGKKKVSELIGIGKQQPITMWCFTLASVTLIGIPPTSAFLSKWYLAEGSLNAPIGSISYIGPIVLLVSALLTAGYLITITMKAFFPGADYDYSTHKNMEPNKLMTVPMMILALAAVLLGMFPNYLLSVVAKLSSTLFG